MALVSAGYEMEVTFVDGGNNTTNRRYRVRGANATDALANAQAHLALLSAASDGAVSNYSLRQMFREDAFSLPASTVQIEVNAQITTYIAGQGAKKASFDVPAPKSTLFVATSGANANIVDMSDQAVIDLHASFQSAGNVYISDLEDAGDSIKGVRVTKGKRGG